MKKIKKEGVMYSVRLEISDKIADKVMLFLNSIPKSDIKIQEIDGKIIKSHNDSLVDFFRSSPLVGEINIERNQECYQNRVEF
jgi:hypothetical protein